MISRKKLNIYGIEHESEHVQGVNNAKKPDLRDRPPRELPKTEQHNIIKMLFRILRSRREGFHQLRRVLRRRDGSIAVVQCPRDVRGGNKCFNCNFGNRQNEGQRVLGLSKLWPE